MPECGKKEMKVVLSKDKLSDLKSIDLDFYEDCVYDKKWKVSFSKVRKTSKAENLELVHIDIWGKASVPSLSDSLYFVTFINGRKVWIYFLKHKSDMFDVFKKWLVQIENEIGLKFRCLKSDNEGEHCDGRFKEFCVN